MLVCRNNVNLQILEVLENVEGERAIDVGLSCGAGRAILHVLVADGVHAQAVGERRRWEGVQKRRVADGTVQGTCAWVLHEICVLPADEAHLDRHRNPPGSLASKTAFWALAQGG